MGGLGLCYTFSCWCLMMTHWSGSDGICRGECEQVMVAARAQVSSSDINIRVGHRWVRVGHGNPSHVTPYLSATGILHGSGFKH